MTEADSVSVQAGASTALSPIGPSVAAPLPPPGERGATDIAERVITKIAGRAACEIDGVDPSQTKGLGGLFGGSPSAAEADAHVDGTSATVAVTIGVRYPKPAWDVAVHVRRQVAERLVELAGLKQVHVQVEIAEFITARRAPSSRVV